MNRRKKESILFLLAQRIYFIHSYYLKLYERIGKNSSVNRQLNRL